MLVTCLTGKPGGSLTLSDAARTNPPLPFRLPSFKERSALKDSGKDDLRVKTFKSRAINMLTYSGHYRVVLRGIEVYRIALIRYNMGKVYLSC
jgi:hypothetical protein